MLVIALLRICIICLLALVVTVNARPVFQNTGVYVFLLYPAEISGSHSEAVMILLKTVQLTHRGMFQTQYL